MTLVRVHIGTTEGPAEIQRLTQEDPQIRSVVCLDGRAVALPISRDYESFVRRPTGLIERLWGGPAFRMDVGARITDGLSWQLGAFLAHALKAADRLAERDAVAASVVWATGEVDASLAVRPVEEVARKLELSAGLLRGEASLQPLVLVPAEAEALARTTLARLGLDDTCRVLGVGDAAAALGAIGLSLPGAASTAKLPVERRVLHDRRASDRRALPHHGSPWRTAKLLAKRVFGKAPTAAGGAALLLLLAGGGWIAWTWHGTVADWTRQAEAGDLIPLDETLSAVSATPSCLTCAFEVGRFRSWLAGQAPADAPRVTVEDTPRTPYGCQQNAADPPASPPPMGQDTLPPSVGACRVRYVVSGAPFVALILSAPVLHPGPDVVVTAADRATAGLAVPLFLIYPTDNRLIALASRLPIAPTLERLRDQFPALPDTPPATLRARLASLGIAMRVLQHRVDPGRPM